MLLPLPLPPQGGGSSEGSPEREELPFPNIPKPDYGAERPQEQTAPEPDNPLPPDVPPNWRPDEVKQGSQEGCVASWLHLMLHGHVERNYTYGEPGGRLGAGLFHRHATSTCPLQVPKVPDPEVPMPRRSEPELPQFPPDVS